MTFIRQDSWPADALGYSDVGVCLALSPLPQPQLLYYGCEIAEAYKS